MSSPKNKFLSKLQGKRVLVFGGTSGIGFGVVEGALAYGANVIISGSNPEKLKKTVQRLKQSYPDAEDGTIVTIPCDLSQPEQLEPHLAELFNEATNGGANKIDHIAFSAGDQRGRKAFPDYNPENIFGNLSVRLIAPMLIAKFIPKYVSASPESSFTLTSGTMSAQPEKGWTSLAIELAPVRVNVVQPGFIETELTEAMLQRIPREKIENTVLTKRLGKPEDTAEA